jgi:hypothetical protein
MNGRSARPEAGKSPRPLIRLLKIPVMLADGEDGGDDPVSSFREQRRDL